MARLTETAYWTRRMVKYGTIGLLGLILLKGALSAAIAYWRKLHPLPPPPPTVAFGKLPKIEFPEPRFKEEKLTYRLETVAGRTPDLGDRTKVYFIPIKKPSLLALDRAKTQAIKMGFPSDGKKISETIYQWQKEDSYLTTLEMDIVNYNFTMRKNWQEDQTLLAEKMLPIKEQAIIEAKNFLRTNGLLNKNLEEGEGEVTFLRFIPPDLIPVMSLSEADFLKVNLFSSNLDNLPLLPPNPKEALVSLLFSGSRKRERRILEGNYTHFPVAFETFATYPLKTSTQAWEELKGGKGYLANLKKDEKEIVIRKISLAYFENSLPQNYLMPIYVFEGEGEFVAYVSAISPEWIE